MNIKTHKQNTSKLNCNKKCKNYSKNASFVYSKTNVIIH